MGGRVPSQSSSLEPSSEARVHAVVADYLDAVRLGRPVVEEDWLNRDPELREVLREFMDGHRELKALSGGFGRVEPVENADRATVIGDATEVTASHGRPPDSPGPTLIRNYEVLSVLGRGGMGVVYKARDTHLKRLVALKMILGGGHASPEQMLRFRIEAEAVARIRHPNIVQIHEVGEHDGLPFFSLEFVEGGTLQQALAAREFPPREAAAFMATAAEAMDCAHRHGVIHRDLKPGNILLTESGEPKITDFGLAKNLDGDSGATQSGQIMGTPSFMAPEQALGRNAEMGPATDVYGLGAILYVLLAGRPPFDGGTVHETLRRVLNDPAVLPASGRSQLPADLATICLKCLEKEPVRRYATAGDLACDLRRFLAGEPISARPVGQAERLRKWVYRRPAQAGLLALSVLASLLVIVLTIGGFYSSELRAARDSAREALGKSETYLRFNHLRLASESWREGRVGRTLELLAECPPDHRDWEWHYLHRLCHSERRQYRNFAGPVDTVVWNSEGTLLAAGDWSGGLQLIPSDNRPIRRSADHGGEAIQSLTFSADGSTLASVDSAGNLLLWETARFPAAPRRLQVPAGQHSTVVFRGDGLRLAVSSGISPGTAAQITVVDPHDGKITSRIPCKDPCVSALAVLPDGRLFAAQGRSNESSDDASRIRVYDADGQELADFAAHDHWVSALAPSPDGRWLASCSDDRRVIVWDAHALKPLHVLEMEAAALAFSRDGSRLAAGGPNGIVSLWRTGAWTPDRQIRGHTKGVTSLAWRGGTAELATGSPDQTVRLWDVETDQEAHVCRENGGAVHAAAAAPDGTWIVAAGVDGVLRIHGRNAETPRALGKHADTVYALDVSSDGRRIAAGSGNWQRTDRPGPVVIYDAMTGREEFRFDGPPGVVWTLRFSQDGRSVIAGGGELVQGPGSIRIWELTSGRLVREIPHPLGIHRISISHNEELLAAAVPNGAQGEAVVWNLHTGQVVRRFSEPLVRIVAVAISPDARSLVAGTASGTLFVWSLEDGTLTRKLSGHFDDVFGLDFSSDGRRLASGGWDRVLRLWDFPTGQEVLALRGHEGMLDVVRFSQDCRQLISGSRDGTVRIWDATPLVQDGPDQSNP